MQFFVMYLLPTLGRGGETEVSCLRDRIVMLLLLIGLLYYYYFFCAFQVFGALAMDSYIWLNVYRYPVIASIAKEEIISLFSHFCHN